MDHNSPQENTVDDAAEQVAAPRRRFFTLRVLLISVIIGVGFSILTPWNDWFLKNTYLNNHYMPLGLTLVLLLMGMVVNPLLGRFRLWTGEMLVIALVMLGMAGVTSSGLMRMLPYMIAAPAESLHGNPRYQVFADRPEAEPGQPRQDIEAWNVPHQLWLGVPEEGDIDRNDPEHRYLVEGYLSGLSNRGDVEDLRVGHRTRVSWRDNTTGTIHAQQLALEGRVAGEYAEHPDVINLNDPQYAGFRGARYQAEVPYQDGTATIIHIEQVPIPLGVWWTMLMVWSPLLFGAILACIGIAGVVRRQWMHNERLPYPIAEVTYTLIEDPAQNNRFAAVFNNRGFWIGLFCTGTIIAWRGLYAYGIMPVDIMLSMDLYRAENAPFAGEPWSQMYKPEWLFRPQVFFSIIALTFFLALDLSFSLWFFFLLTNVVFLLLRSSGIPITGSHVAQAGVGGFIAECFLILWIGRKYYQRVVLAAVGLHRDPEARAAAPYLWALLAGCCAMVAFFVALGSPIGMAILIILLFLGFVLVLARIVAEAGIPYIGIPTGATLNSVFFSIVGFGLPVAMLMPLMAIGLTLLADSREAMLPYMVNGEYLADKAKAPRKRMSSVMVIAAAAAIIVSLFTMVILSYSGDGHPDGYGRHVLENENLNALAAGIEATQSSAAAEISARQNMQTHMSYAAGGLLVIILGVARMFWAWWPFHPIGYLGSMTYATWNIWFSFFLGWLIKAVVMRYGGTALYKSLKPAAIGMIAGEALAGGVFMTIKIIADLNGLAVPDFKFLPG
ncbi:MAG: hypothetical protein EA401_02075 [Planctomycetota bacterium]|nr:MAG: hypothetical protein EA401_02075 [Planctomycetota bacterium]